MITNIDRYTFKDLHITQMTQLLDKYKVFYIIKAFPDSMLRNSLKDGEAMIEVEFKNDFEKKYSHICYFRNLGEYGDVYDEIGRLTRVLFKQVFKEIKETELIEFATAYTKFINELMSFPILNQISINYNIMESK